MNKKGNNVLVIVLSVTGILVLLGGLTAAILYFGTAVSRLSETDLYEEDEYSEYYDDYYDDYDSGYYVPDQDDAYYLEITDATRTDLSYGISWIVESVTPDDEEDSCTWYATWPMLTGDGDFSTVNARIEELGSCYRDSWQDYPGGVEALGYVTYMDETRISVVYRYSIFQEEGILPRIAAVTFDPETGEELLPADMTEIDEELVMRFRAQNLTQNGEVGFVDNASDWELLALLSDPEEGVYFYTPVGLEIGFNYESDDYSSGWVSVTLKEQSL